MPSPRASGSSTRSGPSGSGVSSPRPLMGSGEEHLINTQIPSNKMLGKGKGACSGR